MILVVATLLLVVSVPLTGGRLAHLVHLRLRYWWLLWVALGGQLSVTLVAAPARIGAAVHIATYVLAGGFVVANRALPGLVPAAFGGALNLAAIVANGGVMPARAAALELAGITPAADRFANSMALDGARLWWLGDVFAVPAPVPLANVFSVGDVVLIVGLGILLHRSCRPPLAQVWTAPTTLQPAPELRGAP